MLALRSMAALTKYETVDEIFARHLDAQYAEWLAEEEEIALQCRSEAELDGIFSKRGVV